MGRGTFGNILKISWLIWKIPLVSTSYFSLVPKGVFFWVVNRKDGALQHLDRVDLWHEKEKRSRSWWHDTGFAITVTPNKAFFTKKNFFSSRVVKTVVCWIFIQKTSDSVKFSLIEKTMAKQKEMRHPYLSLLGCGKYMCKFCPSLVPKDELLLPTSWQKHLNELVPLYIFNIYKLYTLH